MQEFGIYDDQAGGFIGTRIWSQEEGAASVQTLVSDGEYDSAEDLRVLEICPDHEEQPKDTCEGCATDGAED